MKEPIHALFVYGTLKRGECREKHWPHRPLKIEAAVIRGQLHDLGPYPALVEGNDMVGGEVWHIAPDHIAHTLAVLDEVEDAAVGETGLYVRREVTCRTQSGESCQAYAYYYSRPEALGDFPRLHAGEDGVCCWKPGPAVGRESW